MDEKVEDNSWPPAYYDGAIKAFRVEMEAMEKAVVSVRDRYSQMVNLLHDYKSLVRDYEAVCAKDDRVVRDGRMKIEHSTTGTLDPLKWRSWDSSKHPSARQDKTADMACSEGHTFTLMNHLIGENGRVSPSVVCPELNCNFHEFVMLEGWK